MTSVFQLGGRYWQKIFVRFGAMCLPGATRIFMHWVCTGRQDGQEEILPKQNRHVGKIKGRENSRPEIIGSKKAFGAQAVPRSGRRLSACDATRSSNHPKQSRGWNPLCGIRRSPTKRHIPYIASLVQVVANINSSRAKISTLTCGLQ